MIEESLAGVGDVASLEEQQQTVQGRGRQLQDSMFMDTINHCFEGENLILSPNAQRQRQQRHRGFFRDF